LLTAMIGVFNQALMITGFVFVMMLVIEYVNVLTSGAWQQRLASSAWGQYLFSALMGALPGCLGSFVVVAMHSHGMLPMLAHSRESFLIVKAINLLVGFAIGAAALATGF